MKLKNIVINGWYTITMKGHHANGRMGKVLEILPNGNCKMQFGHFDCVVYNIPAGCLNETRS